MTIAVKRAYEASSARDGTRVLVDRLWPRGLSKERAAIRFWLRDLAPSDGLRRWFHSRRTQWVAFKRRYLSELAEPAATAALTELYRLAATERKVTLIFSSRDLEHNNAVVLKELIEGMRKPPTSSGPAVPGAARVRVRASRRR